MTRATSSAATNKRRNSAFNSSLQRKSTSCTQEEAGGMIFSFLHTASHALAYDRQHGRLRSFFMLIFGVASLGFH